MIEDKPQQKKSEKISREKLVRSEEGTHDYCGEIVIKRENKKRKRMRKKFQKHNKANIFFNDAKRTRFCCWYAIAPKHKRICWLISAMEL